MLLRYAREPVLELSLAFTSSSIIVIAFLVLLLMGC
jgi:hypothetical protein